MARTVDLPASVCCSRGSGMGLLAAFVIVELRLARRGVRPLLNPVFRSLPFTGANVITVLVYAALNALLFLLMPQLQANVGYSALAAGAALLPTSILMLALSPIVRPAERTDRAPATNGWRRAGDGDRRGAVRPGSTGRAVSDIGVPSRRGVRLWDGRVRGSAHDRRPRRARPGQCRHRLGSQQRGGPSSPAFSRPPRCHSPRASVASSN